MKTSSHFALVAAAGFLVGGMMLTPVKAADLGGDCCADLEERVAELEATTARKGNRVMGVTITGRVDEALLFFDEGTGGDADTYVVDRGSRLRIEGSGTVRPGLKMGYRIQLGTQMPGAAGSVTGGDGFDKGGGVSIGDVYWFAESDMIGRLTVGNTSGAMDNIGIVNIPGSIFDGPGSYAGGIGISGNFKTVGGDYGQMVRWDSPTIANAIGFSVSWGQDDVWSFGTVYSQEFNGLRLAAAAEYEVDDNGKGIYNPDPTNKTLISGSIHHVPTGLYLSAQYGHQDESSVDTGEYWYIHSGVAKDFWGIGQTDFFGEYGQSRKFGKDTDMWGIVLEQTISSVSSTAYINYRNYSDAVGSAPDTSLLLTGVRVNF